MIFSPSGEWISLNAIGPFGGGNFVTASWVFSWAHSELGLRNADFEGPPRRQMAPNCRPALSTDCRRQIAT